MRKLLATTALVSLMMVTPGVVPEAHAGHDSWFAIGSAFRVGAAHISFVFGRPLAGVGPAYYFRYDRPIRYSGYHCNRYCYREAGHYYHHEACPVVGAHFHRYDVDPYYAFSRYAPRYDGYGEGYHGRYDGYGHGYGYGEGYGHYDRYDRGHRGHRGGYDRGYDRHDDGYYDGGHRNHRKHNKHHRRHRHHAGCRH